MKTTDIRFGLLVAAMCVMASHLVCAVVILRPFVCLDAFGPLQIELEWATLELGFAQLLIIAGIHLALAVGSFVFLLTLGLKWLNEHKLKTTPVRWCLRALFIGLVAGFWYVCSFLALDQFDHQVISPMDAVEPCCYSNPLLDFYDPLQRSVFNLNSSKSF